MEWKYFEHTVVGGEGLAKADPDNCFYELVPLFIREHGYLPAECQHCWKPLIFWNYSRGNTTRFKKLLESIPSSVSGKYNDGVVVFYTDAEDKLRRLLSLLDKGIRGYGVDGRTQWRVSGKYWQDEYPEFFISAKKLSSQGTAGSKSMVEWFGEKRSLFKAELSELVGHEVNPADDTEVWDVLRNFQLLNIIKHLSYGKGGLFRCMHPVALAIASYRLVPNVNKERSM